MPQIKSNFVLKSRAANFERDSFLTLKDMRNCNPGHMDDGHISYCKETKKHYVFDASNQFDEITGYFKILTTNGSSNNVQEITNVVFDTLNEMKSDDSVSSLGQIVYCRESKSLYYYAYDSKYNALDPEQIEFDDVTGYFRIIGSNEDAIDRLSQDIQALSDQLMNHIYPASFSVSGTTGTYRQGDTLSNVYITWSMTKNNTIVVADSVKINGENVSDDVVKSGRYTFGGTIQSPNINTQSAEITNSVEATYGDVVKRGSNTIRFIYPKYYGFITKVINDEYISSTTSPQTTPTPQTPTPTPQTPTPSPMPTLSPIFTPKPDVSTHIDDVVLDSNNIMNYLTSGEILNGSKSQTITMGNIGMGRWVYAYPSSLGSVSSILDGNNFDQMGGVSSSIIDIKDPITDAIVPYRVYVSNNSADLSNITIKIN